MNKITSKDKVKSVAKDWKRQYCFKGVWHHPLDISAKEVYEELKTATDYKEVDGIIGNSSWTELTCDECGEYTRTAVTLGYRNKFILCPTCIAEASKLFRRK